MSVNRWAVGAEAVRAVSLPKKVDSHGIYVRIYHGYRAFSRDTPRPAFRNARICTLRRITEILTFDSGFDDLPGIRRLPASASGA